MHTSGPCFAAGSQGVKEARIKFIRQHLDLHQNRLELAEAIIEAGLYSGSAFCNLQTVAWIGHQQKGLTLLSCLPIRLGTAPGQSQKYAKILSVLEKNSPALWKELKSEDCEEMIAGLMRLKLERYPTDERFILVCGTTPARNVHVEWMNKETGSEE